MTEYYETDETELDLIKRLWEKLRFHHKMRSKYFFQYYENISFESRKAELMKKAEDGVIRVDIARDSSGEELVGYCVSSIVDDIGEIDSIYVEESFRNEGIGDTLMKRSLYWLNNYGIENILVKLSAGNDDVLRFYSHYGFYPKHIILKKID